jgi:hypothetical protein
MTWKDFSIMNDYEEARKTSYREVRSHWIGIVDNYNQAISYFLWQNVQYRTPIQSHVLVKDFSPKIYMNHLTAKMIIIINNAQCKEAF